MSEIVPFTYGDHLVRTVQDSGEPWLVAADVCAGIELSDTSSALRRVEEDDKRRFRRSDTPHVFRGIAAQVQEIVCVNESGLYALIFQSRTDEARRFKRWVTSEVLPSLRRGEAVVPAQASPAELSRRDLAEMVIAEADRADAAEQKVAELEPAAESWKTLATASGDLSVADAAKLLSRDPAIQMGRDRLFTVLRNMRWIYRQGADQRWRVYQSEVNNGRLTELTSSHYHPRTGELVLDAPQVRVTVKGLGVLHRHLGGTAALAIEAGESA